MNLQITKINTTKNLLAFSGGVDSSALFFILLENDIPFDMAIVDYNIRKQSKKEIEYAKKLASKYNKKIFIKKIILENSSNFEKKARDIRYDFFKKTIHENYYETLITAHQLNDKLEWFFMQFSKGAGLVELLSFEEFSIKDDYQVFKPLINTTKEDLLKYLEKNKIEYFVDKSNFNDKYKRNYFRKNFANKFLQEFNKGVIKSFNYLENDLKSLNIQNKIIFKEKDLEIFSLLDDNNKNIRIIDNSLKKRGIVISKLQREEILKQKEIVVSHKIAISLTNSFIFISPFIKEIMPKKFKEKCRIKKIPKNIRSYIFKENLLDKLIL